MMAVAMLCPKCLDIGEGDWPLRVIEPAKGEPFLQCSRYPRCRYTCAVPIWFEMRRVGAPALPGFE